MRKFALHVTVAGALMACAAGAALGQWGTPQAQSPQAQAQSTTPPTQGTSRGENFSAKPAPQLFASDCTGAGCHKGPQGLAKDRGQSGLASFLREHYTNSRESAASLATYLAGVPGQAARPDAKPPRGAARSEDAAKPPEDASRAKRQPAAGETGDQAKPAAAAKPPRGRQAAAPAPAPAAAPPEPPAPPPPPPPPQWDIFD